VANVFEQGPLTTTGRPLDVAVRRQPAGSPCKAATVGEAYTRAGNLKTDANGVLQTSAGFNVLGEGGPISLPPDNNIAIAADGTVSSIPRLGAGAINNVNVVGGSSWSIRRKTIWCVATTDCSAPATACRPRRRERQTGSGGARGEQRQLGGRDGQDDQSGAPVRDADQDAADGRCQCARGHPAAHDEPLIGTSMIRSLWTASTGLNAQQVQIDIIANNLANVSTNGFKQARGIFADLLYQTLRQPGAQSSQTTQIPDGLQIGLGTTPVSTGRIFTQGSLQQTGNSLDMAIDGAGFFQVLLPDGTTAYTRDGSFQKDNQGQIVTANGYPLQPAITIPQNALTVTVGTDGVVSITQPGTPAGTVQIGTIQVATFINNGGLQSVGENLYLETASSGTPTPNTPGTNGSGVVVQNYVEASNVNVAQELVMMIQTQRAYELNSKVVATSDQMLARLTQL
jgi:flagellar basal-body rod protein FlgG